MAIRCVYTDLDGTLLGRGGALLKDADGSFSMLAVRGLEACARAGAEVVAISGRRRPTVAEMARLLGQTAFAYEAGCGLVIDGEETLLTGNLQPRDGKTVHELIAESGAPRRLLDHYAGRLEDNGAIAPKPSLPDLDGPPHAYHLMPRTASKTAAVEAHMRARGYAPGQCIAVGDS